MGVKLIKQLLSIITNFTFIFNIVKLCATTFKHPLLRLNFKYSFVVSFTIIVTI